MNRLRNLARKARHLRYDLSDLRHVPGDLRLLRRRLLDITDRVGDLEHNLNYLATHTYDIEEAIDRLYAEDFHLTSDMETIYTLIDGLYREATNVPA